MKSLRLILVTEGQHKPLLDRKELYKDMYNRFRKI